MKFYILHLQQRTFLRSHDWRYASPEAHPGEPGFGTYTLNDAQGYRAILYANAPWPSPYSEASHLTPLI